MARVSFGRPYLGQVRPPLSFGMEQELTSDPIEQAGKLAKDSQMAVGRAAKSGLPNIRRAGPRIPKNPFSKGANPFYGE